YACRAWPPGSIEAADPSISGDADQPVCSEQDARFRERHTARGGVEREQQIEQRLAGQGERQRRGSIARGVVSYARRSGTIGRVWGRCWCAVVVHVLAPCRSGRIQPGEQGIGKNKERRGIRKSCHRCSERGHLVFPSGWERAIASALTAVSLSSG